MKLLSMTDFVLEQNQRRKEFDLPKEMDKNNISFAKKVLKYAKFLKQPLTLGMFVPCDEDGNTLQEPEEFKEWMKSDHYFNASESVTHQCRMYKKAKEKVLFEGFDLSTAKYHCDRNDRTIEYFTSFEVELTPNASKKFEL